MILLGALSVSGPAYSELISSNTVRLTPNGTTNLYPDWSPDGNKIVFTIYMNGNFQIATVNSADGSDLQTLTTTNSNSLDPAWLRTYPDRIAYANYTTTYHYDVWVMQPTGYGKMINFFRGEGIEDNHPCWSPDGKRIAFVSKQKGDFDVWIMDPDAANASQDAINLTQDSNFTQTDPAWSADGKSILYVSNEPVTDKRDDNNFKIFELTFKNGSNTEVKDKKIFISLPGDAEQPAWSPDGKYVAFSYRDKNKKTRDIYYLEISETSRGALSLNNVVRLTDGLANYESPSWSPDGKKIAFCGDKSGKYEIYVMNIQKVEKGDRLIKYEETKSYPNPAVVRDIGTRVVFFYVLNENVKSADISVFDMSGDKVIKIDNSSNGISRGSNSYSWDLKNDYGENVISGAYLYRLYVVNEKGQTDSFTGRFVVVR